MWLSWGWTDHDIALYPPPISRKKKPTQWNVFPLYNYDCFMKLLRQQLTCASTHNDRTPAKILAPQKSRSHSVGASKMCGQAGVYWYIFGGAVKGFLWIKVKVADYLIIKTLGDWASKESMVCAVLESLKLEE